MACRRARFLGRSAYDYGWNEPRRSPSAQSPGGELIESVSPIEVAINGIPMTAEAREFSNGSLSWYLTGETNLKVGETAVSVQVGTTLATVASRELPMKNIHANS